MKGLERERSIKNACFSNHCLRGDDTEHGGTLTSTRNFILASGRNRASKTSYCKQRLDKWPKCPVDEGA